MLRDQCSEYLLQTTVNKQPHMNLNLSLGKWCEQQAPDQKNVAADDLCSLSLGHHHHQSIDCSLRLGCLNLNQRPSTGCTADVSTSLTLCLPGNESRHTTDNDLRTQFAQLEADMAKFIKQKATRIYEEHLKFTEQKIADIENSIKRSFERELAQKDLELETMTKKNEELMQNVRAAEAEVEKYRYNAWRSNAELNYLRNELNRVRQADSGENDAASHVSGDIKDNSDIVTKCRVCRDEEARILLLPCRHLSVCKGCDRSVDACPVCLCRRTQSVEVIFP